MCEEIEGWVQIGTTCCYNYYHNGSTCVHCLAGYYGTDCLKHCDPGFYGKQCVDRCTTCAISFCHHIIGCVAESKESSISLPKNLTHSSPVNASTNFKSHSTVYATSNPSESISENYDTTLNITTKSTNDVISTNSKRQDIATNTTSSKPLDSNIYLMAIGGVIAPFLGILIIQFCIKLCLKRRRYSQQLSLKRTQSTSIKEEETYQDNNESLMTIGRYDNPIEHHQHGKYFELQTEANPLTTEQYEVINTHLQNKDIVETHIVLHNVKALNSLKSDGLKMHRKTTSTKR